MSEITSAKIIKTLRNNFMQLTAPNGDAAEIIYSLCNSDNLSRRIVNEFETVG